jgi:hypothetical protein
MTEQEIRLQLDLDRVTLDDLVMMETGETTAVELRAFLARCAVDKDGHPLGFEEAKKIVGGKTISEITQLSEAIATTIQEQTQVNPTSSAE